MLISRLRLGGVLPVAAMVAGGVFAMSPPPGDDGFGDSATAICTGSTCTGEARNTSVTAGLPSGGGGGGCSDAAGRPVACSDPDFGSWGGDGCYYEPTTLSAAEAAVYGGPGSDEGGWYDQTCLIGGGLIGTVVWRDGASPVPLSVVVAMARDSLVVAAPVVASSPAGQQLVRVPTWLWLQGDGWATQTASASVPGVSVTVTATPMTVTWSLGDGSTVVCLGPGTVYPAGGDPAAASPDCGHTYTRSSAGQPNGAYPVSAVVAWDISWVGAGQQGTLPDLSTAGSAAFRVAESQALIVGAPAGGGT